MSSDIFFVSFRRLLCCLLLVACVCLFLSFFFFLLSGNHRDLHVLTHSFPTRRSSNLQEMREEYALPTGLSEGAEVLYQVWAGQRGIVPAPGYRLEMVVEAVASAGFEVDTANDDRNVIIAKPRSPSKSYADLSAEAAVLMAKAGEAVQWAGPVVRTKSINDAEPKDRGDILIPTDVVIVKIHEDVAQARAMELAEENGLALLKGNPVDNREFYFQLSKDRSDVNVFTASQAYAKAGISEYVTPNFYIFIDVRQFVPNDPLFDRQWPLDNTGQSNGLEDADIDADLAWEFGTGDSSRSEEHKSELQSLMRISYAVFCLKKTKTNNIKTT